MVLDIAPKRRTAVAEPAAILAGACPLCTGAYTGRLCATCAADYEQWDNEQERAAAAFEALDGEEYERWLDQQDETHAARYR